MDTNQKKSSPSHVGKPRRRGVALLGTVALAAIVAAGVMPRIRQSQKLESESHDIAVENPSVVVVTPHLAVSEDLVLPASVRAIEETTLGARTTGYLSKRYVDIGTRVKAGQVLAEIQSPDVDQQYIQAEADQAKASASVGQSQADVERQKAGVAQTQADVAKASAAVAQARAFKSGAESKLSQAKAAVAGAQARVAQKRQALEAQKSNLDQAKTQRDLAAVTAKRYAHLLQQGFVAQQDYDQTQAALKTSTAAVQSAQSSVRAAQADIDSALQDVESAKALVRSAESDVSASSANINSALATLSSTKATVSAARANVGASMANVTASKAQVQSSRANAQRYAVLQSFSKIIAPFDGVITSRNADVGSLISAGVPSGDNNSGTSKGGLFGIARVDTLRIQVSVPQTYFKAVRPGTKAQITIKELPGKIFEGVVYQNAGALDASSRTLLTEVRVVNKGNLLLPGMYAELKFQAASVKTLRVLANTLMIDASGSRVAIVGPDSKLHLQNVVIGRDFGTEVEIVSGLKGDEKLVTNPPDSFFEGETVKVEATATEAPKK